MFNPVSYATLYIFDNQIFSQALSGNSNLPNEVTTMYGFGWVNSFL